MDPEQALLNGTGGEPGADHAKHPQKMRQEVARSAGTEIGSVTPPNEIADEAMKTGTSRFLKTVVHTESGQIASPPEVGSSNSFDDLVEAVRAYTPGGETDRTTPSQALARLEDERQEKITNVS